MITIYLGTNEEKFEWYWYAELKLKCKEYNITIGKNTIIGNDVRIGDNVTIGDDSIIAVDAQIRSNVTIGNKVTIYPHLKIYDGDIIPDNKTIEKEIFIDEATHTQVKIQALRDGRTMKGYIEKLLDDDKERLG